MCTSQDSSLQLGVEDGDGDPFPIEGENRKRESHGTNYAGIIGMRKKNSRCGVGVAYITGMLIDVILSK